MNFLFYQRQNVFETIIDFSLKLWVLHKKFWVMNNFKNHISLKQINHITIPLLKL